MWTQKGKSFSKRGNSLLFFKTGKYQNSLKTWASPYSPPWLLDCFISMISIHHYFLGHALIIITRTKE